MFGSDGQMGDGGSRYHVLARLGSGAYGTGLLARDAQTGQLVFIKKLRPELSADPAVLDRFADEVELLRTLQHPHLVRYLDTFRAEDGELCLVTEFLEGQSLRERLRVRGALPPAEVVQLALPLCDALSFLHGRGVVHRDIEPGNILLTGQPPHVRPKLVDFGLAWSPGQRLAVTGEVPLLTPGYAPPECIAGKRATPASDQYSLGVVLHEALMGAPPFTGPAVEQLLEHHRSSVPPPLPPAARLLEPIVRRCMAKRPEERFGDMGALREALRMVAAQLEVMEERGEAAAPPPSGRTSAGAGDVVGSYQLVRLLGEGGMGKVYLARHIRLGRQVAIKMLHGEAARDRDAVARFFNEARTVNAISHEHIVEVFDFVEEEGPEPRIYCVMELLVGSSLAQLHEQGPLPIRRVLRVCRQVADALAAAHRAGVIHRDVKPANIFVTVRSGMADFAKVLDFGVAKVSPLLERSSAVATRTGVALGTPEYMAPEQVSAGVVDGRTDVYALGVVLHELLGGTRPLDGANIAQLLVRILSEPAPRLGEHAASGEPLPESVRQLVARCLEKDPALRPQTMEEVSASLERVLQQLGAQSGAVGVAPLAEVHARPPSGPTPTLVLPTTPPPASQPVPAPAQARDGAPTRALGPQPRSGEAAVPPPPASGPVQVLPLPDQRTAGEPPKAEAAEPPASAAPAASGPTPAEPTAAAPAPAAPAAAAPVPAAPAAPRVVPVARTSAARPVGTRSNRGVQVAGACAALLLVAGGAWAWLGREKAADAGAPAQAAAEPARQEAPPAHESPAGAGATAAVAPPAAVTPPAAREAPEPEPVEPAAHAPEAAEAQVSLAVTSRPSGATITRLDTGAVVGRTPLETQLAKGTGPLKLRVELAGYRPVERTVPLTEDQDVSVSLQPEREARPKTKPAPRSKPQTEDPDAPLDPFATP